MIKNNFTRISIYSFLLLFCLFLGIKYFQGALSIDDNQFLALISIITSIVIIVGLICTILLKLDKGQKSIKKYTKDQQSFALNKAEKYRREFLVNVSHELKTPIFNIQGYIETLLDGALYDQNVNKKYLKRTGKSVDRLIYIIQDLESISRLDSDSIDLDIIEWNLGKLVDEVIDQFEIKSNKKKITLINKKSSTDLIVLADKDKIEQVLYNLVSNSIKYGKHGGTTVISCHQNREGCFVHVKDDGIGIAEKNIKRLFERFYRVDKSRSRDQGGTGLGLAIVKHIIEAHGQTITVKSELKRGTKFTFSMNEKK